MSRQPSAHHAAALHMLKQRAPQTLETPTLSVVKLKTRRRYKSIAYFRRFCYEESKDAAATGVLGPLKGVDAKARMRIRSYNRVMGLLPWNYGRFVTSSQLQKTSVIPKQRRNCMFPFLLSAVKFVS